MNIESRIVNLVRLNINNEGQPQYEIHSDQLYYIWFFSVSVNLVN